MTKCAINARDYRLTGQLAGALVAFISLLPAHAQEPAETQRETEMEEILVIVDRDGNPVDIDALRYEADMLKAIREFAIEQHKQEEELWRQRLRSFMKSKSPRITWGYDAQSEAARFRYSQANYLPLDRLQPATFVSIRF